jgi:MerR family mercuric resistance operon transcriptional regulator
MSGLTIGEVAEQAKVHVETLRYYERRGLVAQPPRSASNYRLYPKDAVRRMWFIKRAQELGFSLKDIKELLSLRAATEAGCHEVRACAEAKMKDIDAKIGTLTAMKYALSTLAAECSGEGPLSDCPILASLEAQEVRRWIPSERSRFSARDVPPARTPLN